MHLPSHGPTQPRKHFEVLLAPLTPPPSPTCRDLQVEKDFDDFLTPSNLSDAKMEELSGNHLHRLLAIQLSNGTRLVLKVGPDPTTVLLRHERLLLRSEAAAYSALAKTRLPVPKLLKYERDSTRLGAPFLLLSRLEGVKFTDALLYLSSADRSRIDRQLRSIAVAINQHTSALFGYAGTVEWASKMRPGVGGGGFRSWREAFVSMFESIIMDGEDMVVNLPYFQIREALSRWESYLDEVNEARLVVLDLDRPENILIDPKTNDVTGLLDFGHSIWGDPLLAKPEGKVDIRSLL